MNKTKIVAFLALSILFTQVSFAAEAVQSTGAVGSKTETVKEVIVTDTATGNTEEAPKAEEKQETVTGNETPVVEETQTGTTQTKEAENIVATDSLEVTAEAPQVPAASTDNSYDYYFSETCIHCVKLDKYMQSVDAYNKMNITKKDVTKSDNAVAMTNAIKELDLNSARVGTPFLVGTTKGGEKFSVSGDVNIQKHFAPLLGGVDFDINAVEVVKEKGDKTVILIILAILAVIIPTAIITASNKK